VAASGAEGVRRVTLRLAPRTTVKGSPQHSYTVRLHFLEPDRDVQPGQRVFDVAMQGKPLLGQLDVLVESGGACRSIVKCFSRVPVADTLTIELQPTAARAPVLSGVEAVREGG
jgi:hypothetical protein